MCIRDSQQKDVAPALNSLGILYIQMDDYEKALPLSQRALEISEKVLDQEHPDVATTLNNLALLYESMGDLKRHVYFAKD